MSAQALIAKMRRAREVQAEALGHAFTVRIPNAGEMADLGESLDGKPLTFRRIVGAFTVGWDMQEIDLIPGGSPVPAEFHADLFAEWLNSNEAAIEPLSKVILDGIEARRARQEADAKNSSAG
jgi:hypothetical protein